jgi:GR25 family glycosyltransferase involved in LPS biosynthesis
MKVFVINLERCKKEREKTKNILYNAKINFELYNAIDGKKLKNNEYKGELDWYDPYHNLHLTVGEIGCGLSHYNLWEKIVNDKIEKAIILEDDFELKTENLLKDIEEVDIDYEFIYLGRKKMNDDIIEDKINEKLVKPSFSYWTIGYVITYEGAKKLYNNVYKKGIIPIDEYIPFMLGATHLNNEIQNKLEKYYKNIRDEVGIVNGYSFNPLLIKPVNNAFNQSNTFHSLPIEQYRDDVILLTVGTHDNDALRRYVTSCNRFGCNPIVLGLHREWHGGNMAIGIGGGQKINFLKEHLENIKENKLLVFTDSYDVIANNHINILIEKYKEKYDGKIVFGSECSCWPDTNLALKYPNQEIKNKYLNSGVFIGYVNDIKEITKVEIENNADDQLYYTKRYFERLENDKKIILDYDNNLFMCMNGDLNRMELDKSKSCVTVKNNKNEVKRPIFLHGNGPANIKRYLSYLSNYCVGGYNSTYGYKCINNRDKKPRIMIIYDENCNSDLTKVNSLILQNYDKSLMELVYFYKKKETNMRKERAMLLNHYENCIMMKNSKNKYMNIISLVEYLQCEYVFYLNSDIILTNPETLNDLVHENKEIIGPMIKRKNDLYSNFWGDITNNNYYKRSIDYLDIVKGNIRGCWNVPYVWNCILINKKYIKSEYFYKNMDKGDGEDMYFNYNVREKNDFIYVLNKDDYGFIE